MADSSAHVPGYRLQKLEVSNWGTFDSSRGRVHVVKPSGATTLLIGQNGSGKSTLVDALLTLFVRPVTRNYNVAAGANKSERDERTYIKGAFDRRSRDEDNRAEVQYLRPDGRHYSALLATFKNDRADAFTVAQILYLTSDGLAHKIYCLAPGERSIADDCSGIATAERVRQQLEKRGFKATDRYTEYQSWIARLTGMRPKAMDIFNQTVAVKDIQSLNRFIREHMLEPKPWEERIESLQTHFAQLTRAHEALVRVRHQYDLLQPIHKKGAAYSEQAVVLKHAEAICEAVESYFGTMILKLMEPATALYARQIKTIEDQTASHESQLSQVRDEERQLKNDMENAGGERLRQIPHLIRQLETEAKSKRVADARFRESLVASRLGVEVNSEDSLRALQALLPESVVRLDARCQELQQDQRNVILDRGDVHRELEENRRELAALGTRLTKLPERQVEVRRQLCEALRLPESDLPYAAELIAVPLEKREWEASIEMILRSFALSLLVPQKHYPLVSAHVDRNRIRDSRGLGQRLVYLRVGDRRPSQHRAVARENSLLRKVRLKDGHLLTPWVKAELEDRFDYQCCETIEEFQATPDLALTRERHVKARGARHEKDDRDQALDPRGFVLGWDNREKRRLLAERIEHRSRELAEIEVYLERLERELRTIEQQRRAFQELSEITDYGIVDFRTDEAAIADLQREMRSLEESSNVLQTLKQRLGEVQGRQKALQAAIYDFVRAQERLTRDLRFASDQMSLARERLVQLNASGRFEVHARAFTDLDRYFETNPLSAEDIVHREGAFHKERQAELTRLREELEPLKTEIGRLMNHYLREFPDSKADLDGTVAYLGSFCELFDHICREDLPRHEQRFKERLNEKVVQEIGILHAAFLTERDEIEQKINSLNRSLEQLDYRNGTFMKLEPRQVRDPEIQEFQASLRECLSGSFEGTLAADEARYLRIAKLIEKLRDEQRWRERVTDIRKWFDFAAREIERESNTEKGYYEDSTGQSGGEKAKLAFTILVAAIAYQYDIDPGRPLSDRFHFVVVDEMFSKVDDRYSEYALELFKKFGLQLLIVAPLDAKARVTEPYVECYLHVVKDARTHHSEIFSMTAREFEEAVLGRPAIVTERSNP